MYHQHIHCGEISKILCGYHLLSGVYCILYSSSDFYGPVNTVKVKLGKPVS